MKMKIMTRRTPTGTIQKNNMLGHGKIKKKIEEDIKFMNTK